MKNSSPIPPVLPNIYPISDDILESTFGHFAGLDDDPLRVVEENNTYLLPDDDPVKFLLVDETRRDLAGNEFTAYKAGVCVGAAIIRSRMQEQGINFRDYHMPVSQAWSEHHPIDWSRRKGVRFVLRQFFESPHDIKEILQQRVEEEWVKNQVQFLCAPELPWTNDWVAVGMGDICALYGALQGMRDLQTEELKHVA